MNDLLLDMQKLHIKLLVEIDIDTKVVLLPLLLMEGESASLIEWSRSMFEDF